MVSCEISRSFPNTLIRASAGTGKTYQLAHRFLALLVAGERPDHVLAATFARKAAGEILDRVLLRLADASLDSDAWADLETQLRLQLDEEEYELHNCVGMLRRVIDQLHRLRIGTLDSFFIQIAGSFGLDLGLQPGWSILEEVQDQILRDLAVQEVLTEGTVAESVALLRLLGKGNVASSVNNQLLRAISDAYEIYRETRGSDPSSADIPATWNQIPRRKPLSEAELQSAIEALEDAAWPDDKRFRKAGGSNLDSAREEDWPSFLSKGLASKLAAGESQFYRKDIPENLVEIYRPLIEHAQAVILSRLANQAEATWKLLDRFHTAYSRLKFDRRGLRFEDVTRLLADTATRLDETEMAYRMDMPVCQMLLDEFQDTSLAQWAVVRPFAENASSDPQRSLFCVGDVKQAIYGWRGGVSELLDHVGSDIEGIETIPLDRSFRSSQVVIDAVNATFETLAKNEIIGGKYPDVAHVWSERFQSHSTARDFPGYVTLQTASAVEEGGDQSQETLRYAAAQVAELHRAHPQHTIGVLARTNAAVGRLIYELRQHHEIVASEEGGNPLVDSPAVTLVLSLLTIADHPGDTIARFHVAESPWGKLLSFTDWTNDETAKTLSLEVRTSLLERGYGPTIYGFAQQLAPFCDERDLRRLMQLVELAYGYESQATEQTEDFLRTVDATKVEDPTAAKVRVMNVHQSKGLQFDIVVLPELDSKIIPQRPAIMVGRESAIAPIDIVSPYPATEVQAILPPRFETMVQDWETAAVNESLCLLYVAMTRAVHALHMIVRPDEKARSLHATFAGLLRSALTDGSPTCPTETVLWEHGDPEWADDSIEDSPSSSSPQPEDFSIRLQSSTSRQRHLPRERPSQLDDHSDQLFDVDFNSPQSSGATRGRLWHLWFEQIHWLTGMPDLARLRRIAMRVSREDMDWETELAAFQTAIAVPRIARLLSREEYTNAEDIWPAEIATRITPNAAIVRTEFPLAVRLEDRLVSGQIDRLVLFRNGTEVVAADIIDFKTDRLAKGSVENIDNLVKHYEPQQLAYRDAISKMYHLNPSAIANRLVFTEPSQVISIT
ncbi:UvrD-helicase domain-containing protein [Thalassoroseus pseudoceratinae]|uniref:UvrD-helicase domain-containing protein n=1 Tax=Thalassoroseus pseudoceratinae TaxID=2713176 RepID=UPI001421B3B2|nr:UvrD-helicase domain-containing protein [Thalassoroseus pseudoceratinae]